MSAMERKDMDHKTEKCISLSVDEPPDVTSGFNDLMGSVNILLHRKFCIIPYEPSTLCD